MGRYRAEIERDFLDAYSDDYLGNALRALTAVYNVAHKECAEKYPPRVAHGLYPQMRLGMLDRELLALTKDYAGISASMEPNHTGTGFFLLISSGNVFLTTHAAESPNRLPRYAKFRQTYARASAPNLFDDPPEEGEILYAILLHGPEATNKMLPDFAHIVVPNRDCSEYVARIDLFAHVARLGTEVRGVEEEEIEDRAFPTLKPGVERRKDEKGTEDRTG